MSDGQVLMLDEADSARLRGLASAIDGAHVVAVQLDEGHGVPLPAGAREGLARVLAYLAQGSAVAINPVDKYLSTQEAAAFLGVSRPHLIALLDREKIGHQRNGGPGAHRKIPLRELLAYMGRVTQDGARRGHEARAQAERDAPAIRG